jgi:hypothetical protein
MNNKEKINYARDFFEGKDPEIHPMFVKPPKSLIRYSENPDVYIDMNDDSLTYTPEEVEALRKKYFLIIIKIVTTPEEREMESQPDNQKDAGEVVQAGHLPETDKNVSQVTEPASPEHHQPATVPPAKPPKMYHIW